jgi:hypothetical protein
MHTEVQCLELEYSSENDDFTREQIPLAATQSQTDVPGQIFIPVEVLDSGFGI